MSTDIRLKDHNSQEEASSRHNKKNCREESKTDGYLSQKHSLYSLQETPESALL